MKMTTPIDVGHFIASIRKEMQLSQTQLAQKIGKDQRFISKLENDPSSVAFGTVMATLSALGVKMELKNGTGVVTAPSRKNANDKKALVKTGRKDSEISTVSGKDRRYDTTDIVLSGNLPSRPSRILNKSSTGVIKPSIVIARPNGKNSE